MSLATKLLTKTTLVGTIRGNKRKLPKAAKQTKNNMSRFSSVLYKSENYFLYKSKPNKKEAVLSSRHGKLIEVIKKCYRTIFNFITKQNLELI